MIKWTGSLRHSTQAVCPADRNQGLRGRLVPLLLIPVGLLAYLTCFSGEFVFDDVNLEKSTAIRHLWPLGDVLGETRRPVANVTFAISYALGEYQVGGYRALNLSVLIFSGMALYGVVRRTLLLPAFGDRFVSSASLLALSVAMIWVTHPLQTQCVSYVIQRSEALMGMFYLLTMYCVLRGSTSSLCIFWYVAAVVACGLGMGSKAVMVTAPVVVLIFDRAILTRSLSEVVRNRWHLYLGLFGTWYVLVACRLLDVFDMSRMHTVGFGVQGVSPGEYLRTQAGVLVHYLTLAFWPRTLCLDYHWPVAEGVAVIVLPGVVMVAVLIAAGWMFFRKPWLGFVGAWFFVILSPTSSFIPIKDLAFEHRMHLSLAAVVAVTVFGTHAVLRWFSARLRLGPTWRNSIPIALLVVVVGSMGSRTLARNNDYRSAEVMWMDTCVKRPENPRAHYNLGTVLKNQGRAEEAIGSFREALRLDPEHPGVHNDLANALAKKGRIDEAIHVYHEALRIRPDRGEVYMNLGNALREQSRLDEAIGAYREAVQRLPKNVLSYFNLGNALQERGDFSGSVDALRTAVRIEPGYAAAHGSLGAALREQGRLAEAIVAFRRAIHLDPDLAEAHFGLARALRTQGSLADCIHAFREAVRAQPDHVNAHHELANALVENGELDLAVVAYRQALRLQPVHPAMHSNLGVTLSRLGKLEEGIEQFHAALELQPQYAEAYVNLGMVLALRGEMEQAVAAYSAAIRIDSDRSDAHFGMANTLVRQGEIGLAIDEYREVLRIDPTHDQARKALDAVAAQAGSGKRNPR